jgi:hypothetical protein
MTTRHVELAEMKLLVESGAVLSATLEAVGRGLALRVTTRSGSAVLNAKSGHLRVFLRPQSAFNAVRHIGLSEAKIKLAAWKPEQAELKAKSQELER